MTLFATQQMHQNLQSFVKYFTILQQKDSLCNFNNDNGQLLSSHNWNSSMTKDIIKKIISTLKQMYYETI